MTMFNHVSKRFLGNSEETQRHILWDFGGNSALSKFDFDPALRAYLLAKARQSELQTYSFESGRVKLIGERTHIRRHFPGRVQQFMDFRPFLYF